MYSSLEIGMSFSFLLRICYQGYADLIKQVRSVFFFLSFTILTQDCSCESVCALFLQNEENDKVIKQILTVVSEKRKGRRGEGGGLGRKNK